MALVRITLAHLALVALSAGAAASPSHADAFTPVDVAEPHAERELLTRSEAKTRQLERKLAKVKAKREKVDAKVKKVEDALGLEYSVPEAVAAATADTAGGGTWDDDLGIMDNCLVPFGIELQDCGAVCGSGTKPYDYPCKDGVLGSGNPDVNVCGE